MHILSKFSWQKLDYIQNYKIIKIKMWGQYILLKLIKENQTTIKA